MADNSIKPLHKVLILIIAVGLFLLHPSQLHAEQIEVLILKAEKGQVEAQLQLGDAYYRGRGIQKNLQQAFYWYEKAAQQGHPKAQRAMGTIYELGRGTAKDPEKAAYWYRKAAAQGYARAQTNLGILYEKGSGVSQDFETARSWYEKAAAQGYARAQTYLGRMYELGTGVEVDFTKALHWYGKAAEQGYARAQTNLGALYEDGLGIEKNYEKAVSWYRKAAAQQYPRGQFYLGRMFEHGLGVEKDIEKAYAWYSKAATLNYSRARKRIKHLQVQYGEISATSQEEQAGIGQSRSEVSAEKPEHMLADKTETISVSKKDTYLAAAEMGDPHSQNTLALLYLHGEKGFEESVVKAAYWFRKAADNGSIDAQNNLGLLLLNGQGIEKNLQEAAQWLQKAADGGNAAAQSNLGLMYYYGEGVEKDFQQSAFWLLKAAKQGHITAQNNLAVMYLEGLGVKKNQEQAIYWLQKAAEQGDITARKNLAMLVVDKTEVTTSNLSQDESLSSADTISSEKIKNVNTAVIPNPTAKPDFVARQEAKKHFSAGNQYAKEEQFETAIAEYEKALLLDPYNSNTYENLAISFAKTGNFPEAVRTMQTAINLSPDDAMKYSTLGIIYHADNKLHNALKLYIKSVRLNPGFGEMYYNMAITYRELAEYESAYRAALQAQLLGYEGSSLLLLELKKSLPDSASISAENNNKLHLRHIVTSTDDEAEYVLGKLREGADFKELAAQFSLPPFDINGGYIGPYAPNELMHDIAEVVTLLTPLAFSHVIETNTGFHIFQKFMVDESLLIFND